MMNQKATNRSAAARQTEASPLRANLGVPAKEFQAMGELGAMYYQRGQLEKARTIFTALVELDPESGAAHAALGGLLTRTEEFEAALSHLNRAVDLDPREIAPYVNRAEIYIRQQQVEQAVANLKQAVALDPEEKSPAANRARAMAFGIAEALKAKGVTQQSTNQPKHKK